MHHFRKRSAFCLLLTATICLAGCSRPTVSGQVTLDGKALDGGMINFIPADSKTGGATWSEVKAGHYSISDGLSLGTHRVEIRWTHKTGRVVRAIPPSPAGEEVVEGVPPQYNVNSELKAEIKPGSNQADFQLKSK